MPGRARSCLGSQVRDVRRLPRWGLGRRGIGARAGFAVAVGRGGVPSVRLLVGVIGFALVEEIEPVKLSV